MLTVNFDFLRKYDQGIGLMHRGVMCLPYSKSIGILCVYIFLKNSLGCFGSSEVQEVNIGSHQCRIL